MWKFSPMETMSFMMVILVGCGNPGPVEETMEEHHGAGSILRMAPGFDEIVSGDHKIEKLHGGFRFTEGPVWVTAKTPFLLFSDIPANAIYQWTSDAKLREFLKPVCEEQQGEAQSAGSNGLTLDSEGRLVLCEHGDRRISRIEADGTRTLLVDRYQGKRLNSPNDAVYRSDGWLYFTDPPYGLAKHDQDPAKELSFSGVYRLSPDGELELLERGLTRPNGIAFSPDEKTLYVANSDPARKVWMAYEVKEGGTLGEGSVFYDSTAETSEGVPDGLKVDQIGNLYCTGPGGVWMFNPQGEHLGTIRPEESPANVAWGDSDGRTLYMTARTGLYRIRLKIQGIRP